jgi:hypothetical protein
MRRHGVLDVKRGVAVGVGERERHDLHRRGRLVALHRLFELSRAPSCARTRSRVPDRRRPTPPAREVADVRTDVDEHTFGRSAVTIAPVTPGS